jgi:hypothetical protein
VACRIVPRAERGGTPVSSVTQASPRAVCVGTSALVILRSVNFYPAKQDLTHPL